MTTTGSVLSAANIAVFFRRGGLILTFIFSLIMLSGCDNCKPGECKGNDSWGSNNQSSPRYRVTRIFECRGNPNFTLRPDCVVTVTENSCSAALDILDSQTYDHCRNCNGIIDETQSSTGKSVTSTCDRAQAPTDDDNRYATAMFLYAAAAVTDVKRA